MAPSRGTCIRFHPFFRRCTYQNHPSRLLCTSTPLHSGHNRWSKIKHDKGKNDAAKNRQRSIFAHEIANASKLDGPDPLSNPRLADIITKAKREGFAKASIEAAIARGQGKSASGAKLESVTVEGMLPGNVGVVVECETDNKARTLTEVRRVLKDAGGRDTSSSFLFARTGRVVFAWEEGKALEDAMDAALEAGAHDVDEVEGEEGALLAVLCEPAHTKSVGEKMKSQLGLRVISSEIVWRPNGDTAVPVDDAAAAEVLTAFVDELQEKEPAVQTVAMNIALGLVDWEQWRELHARLSV